MMRVPRPSLLPRLAIIAGVLLLLVHFRSRLWTSCFFCSDASTSSDHTWRSGAPAGPAKEKDLACRHLPGADKALLVIKTGSTELEAKLPVHLKTTILCYHDYLIFSDFDDDFEGEKIIDALESVSTSIKETHPDFALWRRLQKGHQGRLALTHDDKHRPTNPDGGRVNMENPGWLLDKWKFLPMMIRTYQEFPNKPWYVFVETDTFIFWHGMLQYLERLGHTAPWYVGGMIEAEGIQFAHGGSGFLVSQPAMKMVTNILLGAKKQTHWENVTDHQWAGDCVLGQAFAKSGTGLQFAWPMLQGNSVVDMDYSDHTFWCSPAVSYHHVPPSLVEQLWKFEQEWIASFKGKTPRTITHGDVFEKFVLPQTTRPRSGWNNLSDQQESDVNSAEECIALCQQTSSCLQYSFNTAQGVCYTTDHRPNIGEAQEGVESGWINERMQQFLATRKDKCDDVHWD